MPIYKCSFEGSKGIKRIRVAKNKQECALLLNYDGIVSPKISEILDLKGIEYILFSDPSLNRPKPSIICDFFEQLSFLLKAGLNIYMALESLGRSGDKYTKHICIKVVPYIIEGLPFYEALNKTKMFPFEVVHQIRAGEESGDLPRSLDRVVDGYRKRIALKSKTITAAIYPSFMLLVMVVVVFVMLNFIVPSIAKSFNDLGGDLPVITQIVINASNLVLDYSPKVIITALVIIVTLKILLKRSMSFKEKVDKRVLSIPLLGELRMKQEIASMCLIMSSLISCGIPIVQSLQITSDTMKNEYLKRKIQKVKKLVEIEGSSLYAALIQVKGFPILLTQLIDVGEKSGDLVPVLEKLAQRYEYYVENVTKRIITLLEPTVIVIMVVVGGTVVIGMMMPIFTITDFI